MSDIADTMVGALDELKKVQERSPIEFDAFLRKALRESEGKAKQFWKTFAEGWGVREGEEPPKGELLTLPEYTEHLVLRIQELPEDRRKVRLAEICTVVGIMDAARMSRLMQEPEPLYQHLRESPPPEVICELCMKTGLSRMVRCERCSWRKVICVECENRKDNVYGIGLDRKVLILHDATCSRPAPTKLTCSAENKRCRGEVQEYVLTDRSFLSLCAGHVESCTEMTFHQGEPVTRSAYEKVFGS